VKRPGLDVKHSPPSGAEINKVYSNTSASIACLHGRLKGLYKSSFYLLILIHIYIFINLTFIFIIYLVIYLFILYIFIFLFIYIYY
jgi:hypothetical protein